MDKTGINFNSIADKKVRKQLCFNSHFLFFHLQLAHYVKYETATFQKEMFAITEDESIKKAVIVSFRGSAKSTIMTVSYPIWAVIGKLQKKFIVILSQTQYQARLHLANIKAELESNELLKQDLGPFYEVNEEWGQNSIVIPKYDARITIASSEQSIRGIRHGHNRPDLIIADDVEDMTSVKTREGRDKTFAWLTGEVIPCGDRNTKTLIIGNLLHEDSLLMRLKDLMENEKLKGVFRQYPLVDDNDMILWPGKYRGMEDIKDEKLNIGNEIAWQREFLLRIVPDIDQLVKSEWIKYYDQSPEDLDSYRTCTGIDLAISEKSTADYTAMVSARIKGSGKNLRILILPNPINRRMNFVETIEQAKRLSYALGNGYPTKLYIENFAYQESLVQILKDNCIPAEGVKIPGDKYARLSLVTHLIETGKVLFPRHGAERLIEQLTHFGIEKHDDLVDAFVYLLIKAIEPREIKYKMPIFIKGVKTHWHDM